MKKLKKVLALVIAAVMIMGTMSVATFAASEMNNQSTDTQIKVTGLAEGDTVKFYQIVEWASTETTNTYGGWKLVDGITGTALGYADDVAALKAILGDPTGNPAVAMQLTSKVAGLIADKKVGDGKAGTMNGTEATLTIKATDTTELGLYLAIITPADQNTVYNPVFVSADFNTDNSSNLWNVTSAATYSDSAAAKKSTVTVDKKSTGSTEGYDTSEKTWRSTRPGEIVSYEVTTTIPGYGEVYQAPHFVVKDKLTDLQLQANSVTLTAPTGLRKGTGTASETATGVDYFITEDTANNGGYTITFTQEYLKKVKVPTTVTITYSAKVTSEAGKNVNVEENEVWVEYSHDPTNESDYLVKKDDTNHYTYTIDANLLGGYDSETRKSGSEIVKVGVDASGNPITSEQKWSQVTPGNGWNGPLSGATFKLYTDANCTNEYTKADGTTFEITSGADGRMTIAGLDAGTYYLMEDKAPNGFIKSTEKVKIEIVPTFTTKSVTEWWNGSAWVDTDPGNDAKSATYDVEVLASYKVLVRGVEAANYTFYNEGKKEIKISTGEAPTELPSSIINTKGVELPSTGGMGTTLFYIIGAILVFGAGVLLVTRRRMNAE